MVTEKHGLVADGEVLVEVHVGAQEVAVLVRHEYVGLNRIKIGLKSDENRMKIG